MTRPVPCRALVLLGLTLFVSLAPAARADVSYQLLSRQLTGFVTVSLPDTFAVDNGQLVYEQAGPFDETITVEAGVDGTSGQGIAVQTSDIGPLGFTATGSMQASATNDDPDGFGEGFGRSFLEVHFTIDAPAVLELTGTLQQAEAGLTFLSLLGPGEGILYLQQFSPGVLPVSESVPLAASTLYRLAIWTTGFGQAFESTLTTAAGAFDITASLSAGLAAPAVAAVADGPIVAPNPIRSFARILQPVHGGRFDEVLVVDVAGRMVQRLEARGDATTWDARDAAGAPVPSGVYFLRLRGADQETVKRVQVLR